MNLWLSQSDEVWRLAGWTMIHFLWGGCVIAAVGGLMRLTLRWAWPNVRYAASLITLLALAATPVVIAGWLALDSPAILAGALGLEHTAPAQPHPDLAPSQVSTGDSSSQDGSAIYAPLVIDLAHADPPRPSLIASSQHDGIVATPDEENNPQRGAIPSPSRDLRGRGMLDAAAAYLPWLWIVGTPLTFCLLAAGLIGSQRLRRSCTPLTSGPAFDACERLRTAMRLSRRVTLAACESIAQPMLIGIARPLILLPASALSGWTAEELEMVLVHELAHVRRWDNLVNLLQRVIESLLFFHPAVWLMSRQVRRDREECCDAAVVARTQRPREYAELLVSMAAALPRGPAARLAGGPFAVGSPMASHPLAGRIRRILRLQEEPMGITRRTLVAMVALPLITVAAMVYTAAAQEEQSPSPSQSEEGSERRGSSESVEEPSGSAVEAGETVAANVPTSWQPLPEKLEFTFTSTTHRAAISKLANQLRTFGNHVEVRKNTDGTVSLLAEQKGRAPDFNDDVSGKQARRNHDSAAVTVSSFPSLEEQKIADRAYKLLGLELEPASAEELARVKKLGYEGGLRIVESVDPQRFHRFEGDLLVGLHVWPITDMQSLGAVLARDDLKQLNPLKYYIVRNREISGEGYGGFGTDGSQPTDDRVVTGRLHLSEEALRSRELATAAEQLDQLPKVVTETRIKPFDVVHVVVAGAFLDQLIDDDYAVEPQGTLAFGPTYGRVEVAGMTLAEAEKAIEKHLEEIITDVDVQVTLPVNSSGERKPAIAAGDVRDDLRKIDPATGAEIHVDLPLTEAPPAQPIYLYDGKTFDQWRESWRQELKTERRLEAIEALGAFGRAGYAKEAAAAILDVAAEYDPRKSQGQEGELVMTIVERVARLPADQWLPLVLEQLAETKGYRQHGRWQAYAARLVENLPVETSARDSHAPAPVPPGRQFASALLDHADRDMLAAIASYLVRTDLSLAEPLTIDVARQALSEDPLIADPAYKLGFTQLDKLPEQLRVVLHPAMGHEGREYLQHFTKESPQIAAGVTDALLAVLADPERSDQHVAAIRALRKMALALRRDELQVEAARAVEALKSLLQSSDVDSPTTVPAVAALMVLTENFSPDNGLARLQEAGVISEEDVERLSAIEGRLFETEVNAP